MRRRKRQPQRNEIQFLTLASAGTTRPIHELFGPARRRSTLRQRKARRPCLYHPPVEGSPSPRRQTGSGAGCRLRVMISRIGSQTPVNVIACVEAGATTFEEVDNWLDRELVPFFRPGALPRFIRFGNWIKFLQKIA